MLPPEVSLVTMQGSREPSPKPPAGPLHKSISAVMRASQAHDHARMRHPRVMPSGRSPRMRDPPAEVVRAPAPGRQVPSPSKMGRVEIRVRDTIHRRRRRAFRNPDPAVPGRIDPLTFGIRSHPVGRGRRLAWSRRIPRRLTRKSRKRSGRRRSLGRSGRRGIRRVDRDIGRRGL